MTQPSREELIRQALAIQEYQRRQKEEAIRWYKPCGPKHLSFHKSQKMIRIVFGGNRSGKSTLGLMELLYRACFKTHPLTGEVTRIPGRYRIFTTKFQIAEEFIIPLLQQWVPKKCLLKGSWIESYDSRYHILKLSNGSLIDIMTYDQETSVTASVELDGVWADEEMPERMYAETITRLISRKGRMWLTVTPLYSLTWAMKFWELGNDPTVDIFRLSIHDNPYLPENEKQAIIANWPEHERPARERGEFLEFAGLVYKEISNSVHLIDAPEIKDYWPVIFTMDPHPRKATVATWSVVTPQEDVIFFDELEMQGTAAEIASAIRAKEAGHKAKVQLRLIDPAAKAQGSSIAYQTDTLKEFEKQGLYFSLADNSEAGYNVVHDYLTYDTKRELSSLNRPRCYFAKDAQKTWHGMTHLLWDEWGNNRDQRDPKERIKDKAKDFPDCVRYTLASRPQFRTSFQPVHYTKKRAIHHDIKFKTR